jgi:hypothetical protein
MLSKIITIRLTSRSFENVTKFRHLGTRVANQHLSQKEFKSRLNSGTGCYHSVHTLLSSGPLYENMTITIYKIIILPVVLYGWETLSLTLREEHGLRVIENRMLRRISRPKRDEVTEGWRKLHNV